MKTNSEEIEEYLNEIRSHIDYEVGDWVETCHMLPGIVQEIDIEHDDVVVFYPHYAFEAPGKYCGGSCCSINHCGVHKITPEYAIKLLSIGEERLKELWSSYADREWKEVVEEEFHRIKW